MEFLNFYFFWLIFSVTILCSRLSWLMANYLFSELWPGRCRALGIYFPAADGCVFWQERTFNEQQRSVRELNLRHLVIRHREQMQSHEHKLLERKHQLMRCEQTFSISSFVNPHLQWAYCSDLLSVCMSVYMSVCLSVSCFVASSVKLSQKQLFGVAIFV